MYCSVRVLVTLACWTLCMLVTLLYNGQYIGLFMYSLLHKMVTFCAAPYWYHPVILRYSHLVYDHFFTSCMITSSLHVWSLLHFTYDHFFTSRMITSSLHVWSLLHFTYDHFFTSRMITSSLHVWSLLHFMYDHFFTSCMITSSLHIWSLHVQTTVYVNTLYVDHFHVSAGDMCSITNVAYKWYNHFISVITWRTTSCWWPQVISCPDHTACWTLAVPVQYRSVRPRFQSLPWVPPDSPHYAPHQVCSVIYLPLQKHIQPRLSQTQSPTLHSDTITNADIDLGMNYSTAKGR